MPTAAVLMAGAAALLNDPNQITYTNTALLPYLKLACDELQLKLAKINSLARLDTSAESTLAANDTEMDPPDDLLTPISVEERNVGSQLNSDWLPVTQVIILPNIDPVDNLGVYAWNEQVFKFIGAIEAREVRIKYYRNLDAIVDQNTQITILNADLYLKFKTAALYCLFPGGQPKKGQDLEVRADSYMNDLAVIESKIKQGNPVRRRRYGSNRRWANGLRASR